VAQNYSFDLDKGTDWEITCNYKDSSCNPINITGATFEGKAKVGNYTGALSATFTITITDAPNGVFKVALSNTATSAMATGVHVYDIEMTLAGKKIRMFEGTINARAEATS
jgi:hypothetical protein